MLAQHFAMLSYEVKGNKMLDFVVCLRLKYLPIFFNVAQAAGLCILVCDKYCAMSPHTCFNVIPNRHRLVFFSNFIQYSSNNVKFNLSVYTYGPPGAMFNF